jgi:hypothetical protein
MRLTAAPVFTRALKRQEEAVASTIKRSLYCWALNEAWERTFGGKVGFGRVRRVRRVWRVGSGVNKSMDE